MKRDLTRLGLRGEAGGAVRNQSNGKTFLRKGGAMKITLELIEGPEMGRVFEFNGADSFLVGRSSKAHLRLDQQADRYISRTHFLLEIRPPRCLLSDLDSTNGTFVNGKRVKQAEVRNGDQIQVGKTKMRVEIKGPPPEKRTRVLCSSCQMDVTKEVEIDPQSSTEAFTYTCRHCQKEDEARRKREEAEKGRQEALPEARGLCFKCGKDLSAKVDSDGKASWLESPHYLCHDCAYKEQKLGLDFDVMGNYLILCELGRGGMGVVYKAVHQPTRRVCALKRVLPEMVREEKACRLFEREMTVQSKVTHPNLVRFLDQGRAGITYFFATEFLAGGDVESLVTKVYRGPLDPALACRITLQVLQGLQTLHDQGFVHRDLKPPNFLLTRSPREGQFAAKISDYGLAKSFENAGNSMMTAAGDCMGSLMFMPPEQIINFKFIKPVTDVYAVGVSLYYMLCAKYTVEFPTPLEMLLRAAEKKKPRHPVEIILEVPPIPLAMRKPDIPMPLARVVDRAVQKDFKNRFQSADEFRRELERVM
jgi:pSer/pThr/pTyr-binding forkhead associated (FHA) protein